MIEAESFPRMTVSSDTLEVSHVDVSFSVRGQEHRVLRDVSFRVGKQETYGMVGESGSGKSTMALALSRYLPRNGKVSAGSITIGGKSLLSMSGRELREFRAHTVSTVYQEPGRSLNPSMRVGRQVAEVFEIAGFGRDEAGRRAKEALGTVQIADAENVMRRYPHQLSGGMAQRVMLAMALGSKPSLLILDEPTTALDATVQAQVLDLVASLRSEFHTSVLFISHNLAIIAKMCDRVGVLYAGELVEEGPAQEVFEHPLHPYTVGLLRCVPKGGLSKVQGRLDTIPGFLPAPGELPKGCVFAPRCGLADDRCREETPPLTSVGGSRFSRCHYYERASELPRATPVDLAPTKARSRNEQVVKMDSVSKTYDSHGEEFKALVEVELEIRRGETLGVVGESGSGKTTLARVLVGLTSANEGSMIQLDGRPLASRLKNRSQGQLEQLQMVFQNPDSALNRHHSVRRLIGRPLSKVAGLSGEELRRRLLDLIHEVKLEERHLSLRPSQLSGGQKQRVSIARAYAGDPRVVVLDEPTSALDVSVQAAILNLLADLQEKKDVTYLFISHDLGTVRYLSDRIAVLYLGRLMEVGPAETVCSGPHHPYTEALMSAVPSLDGGQYEYIKLEGEIPSPANPPSGCVFHSRCPRRLTSGICEETEPPYIESAPGHFLRCHIPLEELRRLQTRSSPSAPPDEFVDG